MRRLATISVLAMFALVNVGNADTTASSPPNEGGSHWISTAAVVAGGMTLGALAVVGIAITGLSSLGKEAYVQQVNDAAADYLADGTESALLAEAIQDVRTKLKIENSASDAAIAAELMNIRVADLAF
jgi:hypothetical protein